MNTDTIELAENQVPDYDTSDNETGCCPRFNPAGWDNRRLDFRDKLFVRASTRSLMHIPLNIGKVFQRTLQAIEAADARDPHQCVVLSKELSPWKAEHYFAVTKEIAGQEMARLSGEFQTRVFEGPFSNMRKWCQELSEIPSGEGVDAGERYFFYTTCPKCAKHYGKNYVVGLVALGPVTASIEGGQTIQA